MIVYRPVYERKTLLANKEKRKMDMETMYFRCAVLPMGGNKAHDGGRRMKPTWNEFCDAYNVIMAFIDTEPESRPVFHALLTFMLKKMKEEEE